MADDIVLGVKIKINGRDLSGEVRLLADDMNRLSDATRNQGDSARGSASGNQQLRNSLRDTSSEARNTNQSINQMARNTLDLNGALRGLVSGLSAIALYQTGKQLVETADSMKLLEGRIKVATSSARDFATSYQELVNISLRTHTSFDANATLFSRVNKAMETMGGSASATTALTETMAQALRISGASAGELSSVVRQTSQALASGVLRGDEFNSIMENGSRLAYALAAGLNVNVGELRKMAENGELTAGRFIQAVMSQSQVIDGEYKRLPMTVGAALQDVRTQFEQYIHSVDSSSSATHGLANAFQALATNLHPVLDSVVTLGKVALAVFAGQLVGAIGQYVAAKLTAIEIERAHAAAITMDLERTVQLSAATLANAEANTAAVAAALAATNAEIAQTQAKIAASVTISRHILLTEQLNVLMAQQTAQAAALGSAQAALATAQESAAAAQGAANATLLGSIKALLSPMNVLNAGIAVFAGWQFASLLDQFESVRRAANVVAGSISHMINLAQYGFSAAGAVLSGRFGDLSAIKQQHYQLQQGISASVADSYLGLDKAPPSSQGLDSEYKKFLKDQEAKVAELAKQQQEAESKKALLDTDIALLKAKGDLRKAYELEATAIKGLDAEGQKRYVQEKLEIESLKQHGKASNGAASEAKKFAKAEDNRRDEIAKTIEQIQFETSLIGLNDKARQRAVELTQALAKAKGAEIEAIKSALQAKWAEIDADTRRTAQQEQSVKDAIALRGLQDDTSEAHRLAILAKELQIQGLSNDAIRDRIDLEKELAAARKTYMSQEHDLDPKEIEKNITARKAAEKELAGIIDNGSQKSADFMEAAWKKAAENIQDAFAQMFENMLNGDALGSFEDFFDNIKRSLNKVFAQNFAQGIQKMLQSAFTSGSSGGSSGGIGGLFSGLFGGSSSGGGIGNWFSSLFGGSSGGNYFKGNGPLMSYQNPASGGLFSQFFSSGSGGGFSFSSAGGGGSGWAAMGSLAKLIPGAGDFKMSGPGRNKSLENMIGIENGITDMVGNVFPLFKLMAPLKNGIMNLGHKLFPDRKPSTTGHLLAPLMSVIFPAIAAPIWDMLMTFMMGEKIPQPTEWTKGRYSAGKMTIGKSGTEDGGNKQNTIDFTNSFGDMITGLGHQLNMTFRDFSTTFWHQLDKTGTDQFAGWLKDKGGNFFTRTPSSDGDFKTLANQASLAVIKRNIANQDDLHYREAIRDSKSLKKLSKAIEEIDGIGLSIGEYGQALQQLKAINGQFDELAISARKYRFAEADIEAARQRAIAALKNDTLSAFRQLAGLGPTLGAQLGALNDQLMALAANAKTLKIAESDLVGLREKAIAVAKEQYLAPLTDVTNSIADQIAQLTGNLPQPEDVAPLYQLLAASTDPTEQARYIERIQRALSQRYNIELAAINKTAQAVNGLKAFVDGLKLSDLSTLDPAAKLREAQGQYGTTLLKAQAGDQAALSDLPNAAQSYLSQARSFYASSPEYAAIFSNVTDTLAGLGASIGSGIDANAAAATAADQLAASLQSLSDVVRQIVATQGGGFDQQAGGLGSVANSPGKNFQDLTEDQKRANIDALSDTASKAEQKEVKAANKQLDSQIKAWLFGGDAELAKTKAYQELTASIDDINEQIKATAANDPQRGNLKAQLAGLIAQRKALGKVKFKEQGGWTQGPTIVGENGPELINFARPTQVQSNRQTQSIIAGGNDKLIAELQKANAELAALVRLQMQANQQLLEKLDKLAGSMGSIERKTRLKASA